MNFAMLHQIYDVDSETLQRAMLGVPVMREALRARIPLPRFFIGPQDSVAPDEC
jgi:hypothetical protein